MLSFFFFFFLILNYLNVCLPTKEQGESPRKSLGKTHILFNKQTDTFTEEQKPLAKKKKKIFLISFLCWVGIFLVCVCSLVFSFFIFLTKTLPNILLQQRKTRSCSKVGIYSNSTVFDGTQAHLKIQESETKIRLISRILWGRRELLFQDEPQ